MSAKAGASVTREPNKAIMTLRRFAENSRPSDASKRVTVCHGRGERRQEAVVRRWVESSEERHGHYANGECDPVATCRAPVPLPEECSRSPEQACVNAVDCAVKL